MSGAKFCALLGELGYAGRGSLDPDNFEWSFQYDDARPILEWICSSLIPSNVLSLSEPSLNQIEYLMQKSAASGEASHWEQQHRQVNRREMTVYRGSGKGGCPGNGRARVKCFSGILVEGGDAELEI
ncbi:hypothetical protein Ancab_022224 [Ancistrocladus abbreviatus]